MTGQPEQRTTSRQRIHVALAAAAVVGLVFSPAGDQGYFAIVLLGPIATGLVAGLAGWPWRLAAAPWVLSSLFFLAYDWVVYNEDVAAHAVLAVMVVGLVALGTLAGRLLGRATKRLRPAAPA